VNTERKPTAIGQRVRQLRDERGWSQLHLAHLTGLALNTISRLEGGAVQDPPVSTLFSLAGAFEITVGELLAPFDMVDPKMVAG